MAEEAGKGAPSLEPPRLWRKKQPAEESTAGTPGRHASPDPDASSHAEPLTAPTSEPEPELAPVPVPTPTRVDTPWIPAGKPGKPARTRPSRAPRSARAAKTPSAPKPPRAPKAPRPPRAPKAPRQRVELPPLNPHLAAAVTGLLVGAWLVLSTFSTLRMCESVRGASACGGPGMLLLVVIVTGGIALGASLLRYFKIRSAGSMSFLAVALVAVLVMVFFAGSLDQWWTIPVVAVITVGAYSLSHWITTTYIDPTD